MGVTGLAETTEPVAELLRGSVARVVGVVRTAVGCVWFPAVTLAELAACELAACELATALMAWVAEAFTLLLEAEVETGDEVTAAKTLK